MWVLGYSVDNAYILLCIIKAFLLIISCRTCNSKMWTYLRFFFYKRLHNWSGQEIVFIVTCLYLCVSLGVLVFWVGFARILLLKKNLVFVVDFFFEALLYGCPIPTPHALSLLECILCSWTAKPDNSEPVALLLGKSVLPDSKTL